MMQIFKKLSAYINKAHRVINQARGQILVTAQFSNLKFLSQAVI